MYNLIYISTASRLLTEYELAEILLVSRENNTQNKVTGMLLYSEGTFIQVLEGEKNDVINTYTRIIDDQRHRNIIELAAGPLTTRNFPDWSMGFASVNSEVLREFQGYSSPTDNDFLKTDGMSAAVMMLKSFAENNKMN
jgi:spore coat polysaccharide biosynthesis protein SpsF (cytidylyltransferase family)